MSRRDTIILAVLINAGLLAILFVTAVHVDEQQVMPRLEEQQVAIFQEPLNNDKSSLTAVPMASVQKEPPVNIIQPIVQNKEVKLSADKNPINAQPIPLLQQKSIPIFTEPSKALPQSAENNINKSFSTGTSPSSNLEVTVKKGDFLEKIARSNGTTVKAIMEANDLKSTHLRIGQTLKIPLANSSIAAATTPSAASQGQAMSATNSAASVDYYIVQSGDNPWMISRKVGVSLEKLLEINGLNEERARKLKPGDQIKIR